MSSTRVDGVGSDRRRASRSVGAEEALNDKDRHVVALAVHVGAPTIVTDNVRHFPPDLLDPFGIER
jgi:hypothetical protein